MIKRILKALFVLSTVTGLVLTFGAAGLSDLNVIDFKTILTQCISGLVLFAIGNMGLNFIKEY